VVFVASGQFPLIVEQSKIASNLIYWSPLGWGFLFSLALFVSVVLHEFGHVLVAQSMGVKVSAITLMMLGGVSEMDKIPEKPFAEFKVAIVGPLVSFLIAGLLFVFGKIVPSPNLQFFSYWLSRVNLVLGVFNLIPAFPLDGGRVIRSLLAVKWGFHQATVTSVSLAKGLSWVLGVLGFLQFNIVLMFIAFFVYSAANQELFMSESRESLHGITVGDVGTRITAVAESDSLKQAAIQMFHSRSRVLPVQPLEGPPMLIQLSHLRKVPRAHWAETPVRDLMISSPHVLESHTPLEEILPELASSEALPFLEKGQVAGVIRYQDLSDLVDFGGLGKGFENESGSGLKKIS
jgi:Zn-dependent protease